MECHDVKRVTSKLERKYRRLRTAKSLSAWKRQFSIQRASTASADPPDMSARQVPPQTSFEPVTEKEIHTLLTNSPAKFCSIDPVPTLLKQLSTHIAPVICFLCNLSLRTGTLPPTLKHALVHPRVKKPALDPEVANNYRPISILPYICKLAERVIARRSVSHATEFDLFPPKQSAYRQFHSTETAVLSVHNDIVRAVDNRELSLLVLSDLSAAFDTVDHHILLNCWQVFVSHGPKRWL